MRALLLPEPAQIFVLGKSGDYNENLPHEGFN